MLGQMRTLAVLAFIAGAAAVAILLAQTPTVADGRVIATGLLALFRPQGVTGVVCDQEISIGRRGAVFACTATLKDGAPQLLDCAMDRDGKITANPVAGPRSGTLPGPGGIRASGDPWGN